MWQDFFAPSLISTLLVNKKDICYNEIVYNKKKSEKNAGILCYLLLCACNGINQLIDKYNNSNLKYFVALFLSSPMSIYNFFCKNEIFHYLQAKYLGALESEVSSVNRNISFLVKQKIDERRSLYNQDRQKINGNLNASFENKEFLEIYKYIIYSKNECENQIDFSMMLRLQNISFIDLLYSPSVK